MNHDRSSGGGAAPPELATDAQLVERVRRGDVQAYGLLVDRHERGLLAVVLPVVRDTHAAQDVVQDVFVQCYIKLPSLRDTSRFGAWLLKAGGRAAVHAVRKGRQTHLQISELPDGSTPADQPADSLLDGDERERLLKCVRCLPAHERLAVTLRYFDGHGVHDVARITGRPLGTVTKQLSRALERLRSALATHSEPQPCQIHPSRMN